MKEPQEAERARVAHEYQKRYGDFATDRMDSSLADPKPLPAEPGDIAR